MPTIRTGSADHKRNKSLRLLSYAGAAHEVVDAK